MEDKCYDLIDNDGLVEVYRGKYYTNKKSRSIKRVIVFDLDETLG